VDSSLVMIPVHVTTPMGASVTNLSRENFRLFEDPHDCRLGYLEDMHYRALGRTGWNVSEVSFGAWAIGGSWGDVSDAESMAALHKAIDCGVNFIDTADVYGMGRSERLIAQLRRERREPIVVATKAGRRLSPHTADGYNAQNLSAFVEDSLRNLSTDCLDLVQLHCPPTDVYYRPEVFGALDRLVEAGKLRYYGVSVERVEEALKAIEYPGVQAVQIIFNCFRHRPAELFFEQARKRQVGILARVPLASGLLTGKLRRDSSFAAGDHRNFNRHGESFDVGETFSGVDYGTALAAVEELRPLVPGGASMAQFALRWILAFDAVTCAIPGGKRPDQVADNCAASELAPLSEATVRAVKAIYDERIRPGVHARW
jgi:aryl-alcohol dehydrogenase-like predicted oxidoreductase